MAQAVRIISPWETRCRWTAPMRWLGAPIAAVLRPLFRWMACTRAFALVGPRVVPKLDRAVHWVSGGRMLMSRTLIPTLLLITTGHRTGRLRRAPMTCLPEPDGSFLVVGSNWGRDSHPNWSISLMLRPEAMVSYRGHTIPVIARLLEGAERAEAWPRLLSVWPVYDRYALRSGRRLRVFRLVPVRPDRFGPPAPPAPPRPQRPAPQDPPLRSSPNPRDVPPGPRAPYDGAVWGTPGRRTNPHGGGIRWR